MTVVCSPNGKPRAGGAGAEVTCHITVVSAAVVG